MKNKILSLKRIISLCLSLVFLCSIMPLGVVCEAKDFETSYTDYACLYNLDYGLYLYEKNTNEQITPAGTVKIMVALLAFEHYDDYTATITVTDEMTADVTSNITGFEGGQTYTVEEILAALIISNSNDAAYILAYDIAGDSASFLKMMNSRAEELGMNDTEYKNITGVSDKAMKTTVSDIATLMISAVKYAKYTELSAMASYKIEENDTHSSFTLYNRNYFISTYYNLYYYLSNVNGLSVSYSAEIGDCLALTARDSSGLSYIVIVMGSNDPKEPEENVLYAEEDAISLMTWGFKNHTVYTVVNSGEMVCEVPVKLAASKSSVMALPEKRVTTLLPSGTDTDDVIRTECNLEGNSVTAPVTKGQILGTMTVYINEKEYTTINLVAKNAVARSNTKYIIYRIGQFLISPIMIVIYCLIIIGMVSVILLRNHNQKLKKNHIYRR